MPITMKFRRTILTTLAALTLASAAAAPATVDAAAPGGGGTTGDSSLCSSLLDRLKRYHQISTDKRETKSVREFYAARARATLFQAQQAGCGWAALTVRHTAVGVDAAVTATARSAKRGPGQTGPKLGGGTVVARIKATQTGGKDDEYCRKVADLINEAESAGDQALLGGDEQGAQEWYALADYYLDRSTQNGCRFTFLMRGNAVRVSGTLVAARG